jgi:hypothetical protein
MGTQGYPCLTSPGARCRHDDLRKGHDEVLEVSTSRIACTLVQNGEHLRLAADLFQVLPNEERSSDDLLEVGFQ